MTNESPKLPHPVPPPLYDSVMTSVPQPPANGPDPAHGQNDLLPSATFAYSHHMSYNNNGAPIHHNKGYHDPPLPVTSPTVPAPYVHQWNPTAGYPPTFMVPSHDPIAPGPPRADSYNFPAPAPACHVPGHTRCIGSVPLAQEATNEGMASVAGPSLEPEGSQNPRPPRASTSTDTFTAGELKRLASRYIRSPESRVRKLRMRQGPPGWSKVNITVEVADRP
ncbi:hypothetical protein B0F90DRAFT_1828021 [Multifurca ochricompacta]|uniref:Uncharacterized protein n=1 Tax=Multifurca ochricompacta TaxID=376703 RepID=A0AAD4LST5_9AGAM|nr:hypothetical protein B0F90DRAFT_1828021 [Multifurca ochricompacta]